MRVLVVRTGPLFAYDDTRLYAARLCSAINALGHSAELATIPFSGSVADLAPETTAYRLLDLRHGGDQCIALGPFAYAVSHVDKRVWAFEQYDAFHSLWGTDFGAVTASHTNVIVRNHVYALDRAWLSEARNLHAASQTLSKALSTALGKTIRTLRPGIVDELRPTRSDPSPRFVAASRLSDRSRLTLIIAALEAMTIPARLLILGYEGLPEEREYVEQRIAASSKRSAIELEVDADSRLFREAAGSAAALVSTGFHCSVVSAHLLAAGAAEVPIVTTTDAGEPAVLVEEGVSGRVVEPRAEALAQAMSHVLTDPQSAARCGHALSVKLGRLLPGWDTIATELTR